MRARRAVLAGLSAVLVAAPVVTMAAPAEAANAPCATRAEYRAIHRGMTMPQVARVIGYRGKVYASSSYPDGYRSVDRSYNVCNSRWGVVSVFFARTESGQPVRMTGKAVYW